MNSVDDRLTFLLPRPVWVNDLDVSYCSSCNQAFGPLKRRHHCRNCGNIFCHECSSRKVPLPQLGYGTKPVRVCNGCFDVCYLVTYAIDEDHGLSTQIHGVRGLLELTEKDDEKDLHNMVAYGGVDALIWLSRSSKSMKLHHLTTTILALLAEKESIRPVIITKWALPPILALIRHYTSSAVLNTNSPANSIHSGNSSEESATETRQSIILEIIINCTHILYQVSRAGILSQKEVISEGVFETLVKLASFHMNQVPLEKTNSEDQQQQQQQIIERVVIFQNLAAKAISAISSLVAFQASIIETVQGSATMADLLRSENGEVRKYMAKTIAYLSLRNDKYKPKLLQGEGSRALVSILVVLPQKLERNTSHQKDLCYYLSKDVNDVESITEQHLNSASVSHACCALANFATNNESQINLMSQPHLLRYICNVPLVFPSHTEIHRHVVRCLANLSLYEKNLKAMLTNKNDTKDGEKDTYNVLPSLLLMGKSSMPELHRHIVRAIDNLGANLSVNQHAQWKSLFGDAYDYMCSMLEQETDVDTMKRAKGFIERENRIVSDESPIDKKMSGLHVDTQDEAPAISPVEEKTQEHNVKDQETVDESVVPVIEQAQESTAEDVTTEDTIPEEPVTEEVSVTISSTEEEEGEKLDPKPSPKSKKKSRKHKK